METNKMGITPSSNIWLLNIPELSPDYSNTYHFDSPGSQQKFFNEHIVGEPITNYTYLRKESSIKINKHVDSIHNVNYLMYDNRSGKRYYCFILSKNYINERVTELIITTDLLQTYMFDYEIKTSFVERCHVKRWTIDNQPTPEYVDEGLEFGEYMQIDSKVLHTYKPAYVAVCSNPLGKLKNRKIEQGGGGGTPSGNWLQGTPSRLGIRFIKGFEGFSSKPYDDGLGYMTIGYGTTQKYNPTEYNQLLNGGRGCTEEEAAKVFYNKFVKSYCKPVVDRLKQVGITKQCQADALFSIAYNCGVGDVTKDTELMLAIKRNPNDRNYIEKVWHNFRVTPGKPTESGLRARRKEECNMYFGTYSKRPISKIGGGVVTDNNGDGWLPNN